MLMPEALEGQTIGKYLIQKKVGEGGMACVYRAIQTDFNSSVALKVLFPEHARKELVRKRFLREARLQFRIQHPNIVRVLEMIEEEGLLGMVMDWVDGADLEQYLRRLGRPLKNEEILEIFLPVLDAVGYAHQHQVIHRDLKPSNIVLERNTRRIIPKVMDFGIAKSVEDEQVTNTGVFLGTPAFLAPEQVQDARKVDHRVDIYALGICLFRAACGQLPFSQGDFMAIIAAHLMKKPPPMSEFFPQVDPRLEPIVQKALEKDPRNRFFSCEDFAATLQETLSLASAPTLDARALRSSPGSADANFATVPSIPPIDVLPSSQSWDAPSIDDAAASGNSALQSRDTQVSPSFSDTPHAQELAPTPSAGALKSLKTKSGRRNLRPWLVSGSSLGLLIVGLLWVGFAWFVPRLPKSGAEQQENLPKETPLVKRSPVVRPQAPEVPKARPVLSKVVQPLKTGGADVGDPQEPKARVIPPIKRPEKVVRRKKRRQVSSSVVKKSDLFSCFSCLEKNSFSSGSGMPDITAMTMGGAQTTCNLSSFYALAKKCRYSCRKDYRVICASYGRLLMHSRKALFVKMRRKKRQVRRCLEFCSHSTVQRKLSSSYGKAQKLSPSACKALWNGTK
ncbi:MAG: serine/threonine protein kinase [Myxococcales bacterium]|nr:serine/threonine protein kinase [Myxococcales bacterium]